jgi:hypothetical protein
MTERRRELGGDGAGGIRHGRSGPRAALAGGILAADVAVLLLVPLPMWVQGALGIVAVGALSLLLWYWPTRAAPFRDGQAR